VGMCKTKNFVISKYQTAIRRFLTVEVQVWSQVGYMVEKVVLGKVSLLVLCLSTVIVITRWSIIIIAVCSKQIHPCVGWILLYITYSLHCSVQDTICIEMYRVVWCNETHMELKCTILGTDSFAKSNTKEMASGDLYQRRSNFVL
jgi:hypothetical protein